MFRVFFPRAGLQTADDYVWLYSEQPRWWSAKGGTVKLPSEYERALRRAREDAAKGR